MKTQLELLDLLNEGQLKAIALLQFNGEDYFLHENEEGLIIIYGINEDDAKTQYEEYCLGLGKNAIAPSFDSYVFDNFSDIAEIEGDEEVNNHIVLTDQEADDKAKDYILDSAWAFNASFLADFTGFDIEVFEAIQKNDRCESNNDAILSMIQDKDDFVQQAISADGRGHFMNRYDGNENEETIGGETFYIYRMN